MANTNQNPDKPTVTADDPELLKQPAPSRKGGSGHGASNRSSDSGLKDFGSFIGILAIAGVLAFLLISFVFRSYAVDGPSMESALQNGDKLIIWKVPRTIARITHHQYVPQRGDVIIFNEDNLAPCGQDGERQLIKRVIGLPGEHVVVNNGKITIYNKDNLQGFDPDTTLAYNKDGHIATTTGNVDVTLGKSQLFVSGDNRPESCDSRAFGPVNTDKVIGKLVLRLLPADKIKSF